MELKTLKKLIVKDLKEKGYINKKRLPNYSRGEVYFDVWIREGNDYLHDCIVVYVLNSHNSYLEEDLRKYRQIAKCLVDCGYDIEMSYPCYLYITEVINRF